MTTVPAVSAAPGRRSRQGVARAGRWAVRSLLAAQFVVGGVLKLTADPQMVAMFDDIGAGQGLRLLVGACEVAGGIGVLLPGIGRLAAAGLMALMTGAALTNVVALHTSPAVPLVLLALALLVAATPTRKETLR